MNRQSLALTLAAILGAAPLTGLTAQAQTPPSPAPARVSWTSDVVTVREGDLVTILIDEFTIASADRDDYATNERDRNVGLSTPFLGGSLRSVNDRSSVTRGLSSRRERFQAEISAMVVEVLPGGVARIEGVRRLMIDDHEQDVTVRGLVRSQDISSENTVESWRVANAEVLYDSNRELGSDKGIWSRLFGWIIP